MALKLQKFDLQEEIMRLRHESTLPEEVSASSETIDLLPIQGNNDGLPNYSALYL
jgi:hypothetical protein